MVFSNQRGKDEGNPGNQQSVVTRLVTSFLLVFGLAVLHTGCARHNVRYVSSAFYFWRTDFSLSTDEQNRLETLGAQRVYVRMFDVDWDIGAGKAYPVQTLRGTRDTTMKAEIVPTIFITNRTFTHIPPSGVSELAGRILRLTLSLTSALRFPPVHEMQIDCDWTEGTRGKYFALARELRALLLDEDMVLSATIRLHQVKYRNRTGVPPVDRGVLMFYNMGEIDNPDALNSILDLDAARKYIASLDDYPLPLDVALPLYSWGVVYRRGRVVDLINNVTRTNFSDDATFALHGDRAEVLKSSFVDYRFLYAGDVVRLENVPVRKLHDAASLLARHIHADSLRVVFFHLDSQTIHGYKNEDLQTVCAAFR